VADKRDREMAKRTMEEVRAAMKIAYKFDSTKNGL
jgi:hypothetical protein